MSIQLMRLRGVPEDEADEVRELLTTHHIDFYETPAGNWGISMPAIWLDDESQQQAAKGLLADYQTERQTRARAAYEAQRAQGQQRSLLNTIAANPLHYLIYLLAAALVLYLSIKPFVDFGSPH